ncbi:hypothetical protein ACFZBU_42320 [Embleya sp. NPDC008237]|uniref:hypothetical protein n=1 Tax=Embleya sp. NPDC008237 TaxID=3363978 RepID=UPI0036E9F7CC
MNDDDEYYVHLRIIECSADERTAAALTEILHDAGFTTEAERHGPDPAEDTEREQVSSGAEFTAYGKSASEVRDLLDALAARDRVFAGVTRTEEERGEPGELAIRLPASAWFGKCDRSGTPVVEADAVVEIAAEPDPRVRARLLDDVTGTRARALVDDLVRIQRLQAIAAAAGIGYVELKGAVEAEHDAAADNVNNGEVRGQLSYLAEGMSDDEFRAWIRSEFP